MDSVLRSRRGAYVHFLRRLRALGVASLEPAYQGHVGLFFVRKRRSDKQTIIDARAVNESFRTPLAMQMTSPEGLSRVEAGNIDGPYVSNGHFVNCFHRLRVFREFSVRFAGVQHDHLAMLRNAANGTFLVGVFGSVGLCANSEKGFGAR